MYNGLLHAHSGLRYLVLLFLIIAVAKAVQGYSSNKTYSAGDNKVFLFAMITAHIQLTIGLFLFFVSGKGAALSNMGSTMADAVMRYKAVEHPLMMIIALVLITMGRSKSKKASTDLAKYKSVALFYGLGLVIILAMIPWPFLKEFGTWF